MKSQISQYDDFEFRFLKKAIKNIPYFRQVSDNIIQEVVYMLTPKIYEAGSIIVNRGDEVNDVYLLGSGAIIVEVPTKTTNLYLDWLNEGSCFCIYSSFSQDFS